MATATRTSFQETFAASIDAFSERTRDGATATRIRDAAKLGRLAGYIRNLPADDDRLRAIEATTTARTRTDEYAASGQEFQALALVTGLNAIDASETRILHELVVGSAQALLADLGDRIRTPGDRLARVEAALVELEKLVRQIEEAEGRVSVLANELAEADAALTDLTEITATALEALR